MSDEEKGDVTASNAILHRICTKDVPFRPGVDDDTYTFWEHEGAALDDLDFFWVCSDCGAAWYEEDI